ncbi:MAG: 1,4-dihydroxy-2-naphthoate polyprenyltransferase [Propionibacteriales bacterium]|nr:1,4-dihydroxy-2-naphthoate polyprenyltransferase [Propionibacteriales bacterium]
MATIAHWVEGARPRTLPAAISPVVAGSGAAYYADGFVAWKALLALVVALSLQVAVNYANDYSDGLRGTDDDRVGPQRLVGSGAAAASAVKAAAFASFGVAALCGLVLAATTAWWLVAVGAVAMLAAWYYTGGSAPYGYRGLGEVSVFVFFGLVAVVGTTYVQTETVTGMSVPIGVAVGALACAILVANNLRDAPTDEAAGKQTLAVVMGDQNTRVFYLGLLAVGFLVLFGIGWTQTRWAFLGLLAAPLAGLAAQPVRDDVTGPGLVRTLKLTGICELVYAVGLTAGLVIAA